MIICTVQFNYEDGPDYALLLAVFKKSCLLHMPDVKFHEIRIDPPAKVEGRAYNYTYNTVKLRAWVDFMESATEPVIFADCDMLCTAPAYSAFDVPFDVAYTKRTTVDRIPMNGGIFFARPTIWARMFFRDWLYVNNEMYADPEFHAEWRERYAGMNQAAFGYLYEKYRDCPEEKREYLMHEFSTRQYNAVDCDWSTIDNSTVFVHIKSKLRKAVLSRRVPYAGYRKAMESWYAVAGVQGTEEPPVNDRYRVKKPKNYESDIVYGYPEIIKPKEVRVCRVRKARR